MARLLDNHDGKMTEDSVGATVWNFWNYFFAKSMLINFTTKGKYESLKTQEVIVNGKKEQVPFWDDETRVKLVDNYMMNDYISSLIKKVFQGKEKPQKNKIKLS